MFLADAHLPEGRLVSSNANFVNFYPGGVCFRL